MKGKNAEQITSMILKQLEMDDINIQDCRGQAFDNVAYYPITLESTENNNLTFSGFEAFHSSGKWNQHQGQTQQWQTDDDQQRNDDECFPCDIKIEYKKSQCRKIWPKGYGCWSETELEKIFKTYSEKESPTTTTPTPETTTLTPETTSLTPETTSLTPTTKNLTLVYSLATLLVLAIIFILFLILWISFRRKRNSTNVQNVNENNHPYEEIDETTTTISFCNSSIVNKNTATTTNPRNISEETYEALEEESAPRYDKLAFNELEIVNNENRNNSYHVVEK
ncbi:uncharacterized protein LOC115211728 [Octopus sinensis]|uniref:Uncharacterized protein LOC115211728 n=1 Tax=Octopus sinensis TaxID=2607531 RepID=A0A6P7SDX4_9MOLL|nr:uncharacterized protein LOC115211728 [Octopus sinensis]